MRKQTKIYVYLALCVTILSLSGFVGIRTAEAGYPEDIFIIDDERNIVSHIWSSDGTKIAYQKLPDGQYWNGEIWVADKYSWCAKLKNRRLIYTGVEGHLWDWQGDWILFLMRKEEVPSDYNSTYATRELWKIKADGTELTQVTFTYTNGIRDVWIGSYPNMGTVSWGRFIPGTDLIYFSAHDGNGWYRPYTCKADGSDQWNALSVSPYYYSFVVGMSPTGNKLLWGDATYWNNPTRALMACNPDGSELAKIGSFDYRINFGVLADGNTVVYHFALTRGIGLPLPYGNIYTMDIDGSNPRTVIGDEYVNHWVDYNPIDAQALVMRSNRSADGNFHMYTINLDGTGIVQLTDGPYHDEASRYSPDGQYIMYRRLPDDIELTYYGYPPMEGRPYPYELVVKRVGIFPTPGFSFLSILLIVPVIVLMKRRKKIRG